MDRFNELRHKTEKTTNTWLTPPYIFKPLGPFDLDPCCPPNMPWKTAKVMLTEKEDGLKTMWRGADFVFCNPPYGAETAIWLEKMAAHNNGIALTFARTETKAFTQHVWGKATGILFLSKRVTFLGPDGKVPVNPKTGKPSGSGGAPSVLIAYGIEALARLEEQHGKLGYVLPDEAVVRALSKKTKKST